MRILRLLLIAAIIVWAFATLGFVRWIRERYGRGGPIPVSQAGMLLPPLRRFIDPVGPTMQRFRIERGDTVLELGPGPGYFTAGAARGGRPRGRPPPPPPRETLGDPDSFLEATLRALCRACGFEPLSHDRLPLGYAMSFTRQ